MAPVRDIPIFISGGNLKVQEQSPAIDGNGTPFIAFQAVGSPNNRKYCRICRIASAEGPPGVWKTVFIDVPNPGAEVIYTQPMWAFHKDGTAVVMGMNSTKTHFYIADVPEFVPLSPAQVASWLKAGNTLINEG